MSYRRGLSRYKGDNPEDLTSLDWLKKYSGSDKDSHLDLDRYDIIDMLSVDRDEFPDATKWLVYRWRHKIDAVQRPGHWIINISPINDEGYGVWRALMLFGEGTEKRYNNVIKKTKEKGFFKTSYRWY
jgi:hypothetical protein